jgi:DNA repair protein RecO (recombination protein O)
MNWSGPAIVLSARAHGEGAAIAQVFAREHGQYGGLVHGRRRKGAALQPGSRVEARWRARLAEHLGVFTLELSVARASLALGDRTALAGLSAACALAESTLPERDPHPAVFDALELVLSHLGDAAVWPALYVRWELGLLADLGFGIALDRNLLPRFLLGGDLGDGPRWRDIAEGLSLTGHLLETRLYAAHNKALPDARVRLAEEVERLAKAEPSA